MQKLTNEELALRIQQGERDLIPVLWEQVYRMVVEFARRYFVFLGENKRGVEIDDLVQQGYFALIKAIRHYKPEKGFAILTLLGFTVRGEFAKVAGLSSSKRHLIDYCVPLDMPVGEDGDNTLSDFIPDKTTQDAFEQLLDKDVANVILREACKAPYRHGGRIIRECAYKGKTLESYGLEMGISKQCASYVYTETIEWLRKRPVIRALGKEYRSASREAKRESRMNPYRRVSTNHFLRDYVSAIEAIVVNG